MFELRHPDAVIPIRATSGAAGFDLSACHDERIVPGNWMVINTGVLDHLKLRLVTALHN